MKRLFTFLFSLLVLLWIVPQETWADDVTVYFRSPWGNTDAPRAYVYDDYNNHYKAWESSEECTKMTSANGATLWKYSFPEKYSYIVFKRNDGGVQYPASGGFKVVKDGYYDQNGSTSLEEIEVAEGVAFKYWMIGGVYQNGNGIWSTAEEVANKFYPKENNAYKYIYKAEKTGELRLRITTSYTNNDGTRKYEQLYPEVTDKTDGKGKKLTSDPLEVGYSTSPSNYWYLDVTAGKTYVFTLNEPTGSARTLSYVEQGSVVTKTIKLFDGESEIAGSDGKFTYDLSSATADANLTITIDGTSYGLATAQTISAVGTTENISFNTTGTDAKTLTLKAGLVYTIAITDEGVMTVVATEKGVTKVSAAPGYYLMGNFFSPYNNKTVNPGGDDETINYNRWYFKFEQQKDGSYAMNIPACLTAHMQIVAVDDNQNATAYGPGSVYKLHGANIDGTAYPETNGTVGTITDTDGKITSTASLTAVPTSLEENNNYWDLTTRNDGVTDDDGMYIVSFMLDKNGVPSTWSIKHDALTRVAYLFSTADGATAQPLYNVRKSVSEGYNDNLKAAIHFDGNSKYFVIGTVVRNMVDATICSRAQEANDGIHEISSAKGGQQCGTHNKLFFLGTQYTYDSDNNIVPTASNKLWGNMYPVVLPKITGTKIVEVNPTRGYDTDAQKAYSYGLQADFYIPGTFNEVDYPDAISMVGPAIAGTTSTVGETTTWNWASTVGDMIYDESDRCYKLVLNTSATDLSKTFRFVGDHQVTYNWYEDETPASKDFNNPTQGTSAATVSDPNYVNYVKDATETSINHNEDIMWNRPAGLWTVRFYIDTDNNDTRSFRYTISGASKIIVPVVKHCGKLLRTYASAIDVVPLNQ